LISIDAKPRDERWERARNETASLDLYFCSFMQPNPLFLNCCSGWEIVNEANNLPVQSRTRLVEARKFATLHPGI
jgi:hypothetical protein